MSGSISLPHPGSVLISVALETIEDCADVRDQGCHLGPCWYLRVMLVWGPCQSRWPALLPGTMVISRPRTSVISRPRLLP